MKPITVKLVSLPDDYDESLEELGIPQDEEYVYIDAYVDLDRVVGWLYTTDDGDKINLWIDGTVKTIFRDEHVESELKKMFNVV